MDGATEDVNQCYADAGIAPAAPKRIRRDDASPDSDATVSTGVTPLVIAHYDGSYAWPGRSCSPFVCTRVHSRSLACSRVRASS